MIGDFRAPDIMRFGFTPLYLSLEDVEEAARRLGAIIREPALGSARIPCAEQGDMSSRAARRKAPN